MSKKGPFLSLVKRSLPKVRHDEGGAVILFVAASLVIILAMGGLALDMGKGYIRRARMTRAVDAAALAGARVVRDGQAIALQHALSVAQANGLGSGVLNPPEIDIQFGTTIDDETTVLVTALTNERTILANILGHRDLDVVARAQAATPPVDLMLVIDHSGSLKTAGAWGDLQDAAKNFVGKFDDSIDQVGMVGFNTRATQRYMMSDNFTNSVQSEIDGMISDGWTNTGEALRLANEQYVVGPVRSKSAKVVVFFTDGRPTAFRGDIGLAGDIQDRVLAAGYGGSTVAGYWDDPLNTLPDQGNPPAPDGCSGATVCLNGWNAVRSQNQAHDNGRFWADAIRAQGVYVYTIGLGFAVQSYLQELANEGGISDPNQLQGRTYIAPTADDLQAVFDLVASDIFVRLAQ